MKKKVSVYSPFIVDNNAYVEITKNIISQLGVTLMPIRKCLLSPVLFFQVKSINFNWYERATSWHEYILRKSIVALFKIFKKKIIYTLHNKQPHNIQNTYYSDKLMKYLLDTSDEIIGHCNETISIVRNYSVDYIKKLKIIPLPNYISVYKNQIRVDYKSRWNVEPSKPLYMYFGNISPYKNIELLIDAFNKSGIDAYLAIVGKPCTQEYKSQIMKIANNSEVILDFEFIPDESIESVFSAADIMVMPYDKTSSLNASAVILSYSMKKTVICPCIGTIRDHQDKGFVYQYDYSESVEHLNSLTRALQQSYTDYLCDNNIFMKKGMAAFEYVKNEHSKEKLLELYKQVYSS